MIIEINCLVSVFLLFTSTLCHNPGCNHFCFLQNFDIILCKFSQAESPQPWDSEIQLNPLLFTDNVYVNFSSVYHANLRWAMFQKGGDTTVNFVIV